MAILPPDHTETLLRITETLGRVDARTMSMETQAANDRIENRDAHKALGIRIDLLETRVAPIEDRLQDARTTARNLKIAVAAVGSAFTGTLAIGGDNIRAFIGHLI